jgi:hypothetical protein
VIEQGSVRFICIDRKHDTTVHFDEICLELFDIVQILGVGRKLINGGKGQIRNVDDLVDKVVCVILHGEHEVANATDDAKLDFSIEVLLNVDHQLLHDFGSVVEEAGFHHAGEITDTGECGLKSGNLVDFLEPDFYDGLPVLVSSGLEASFKGRRHGAKHAEAFRLDTELVYMVVNQSAEFGHELLVGYGVLMSQN